MNLEEFYEQIDKKLIENFIKDKQEEHLNLEFKTVKSADLKDKEDKRNFAKTVSGFSNSSGGIIVWGVEARKINGIDCACGSKEILPLSQFVSRLNNLTGELVKPIVEGVKHKKITTSNDKGFAVTFVPESDAGPHMAMGFEGRHYKRSGDSFYPMEHFDIEDMFGRRKKPLLSLDVEIKQGAYSGNVGFRKFDCHIFIGIMNSGRGIAKYVAVEIKVNEPYHLGSLRHHISRESDFKIIRKIGSEEKMISVGSDVVIHPKSSLIVAVISFKVAEHTGYPSDVEIDAEIMAEDMQITKEELVLKGEEIRSIIKHFQGILSTTFACFQCGSNLFTHK